MPLSIVLDIPPLDLQGVGRRARPTEGTGHLYILTTVCRDVVWDLCKQCCNRETETERDGLKRTETLFVKEPCDNVALLHHTHT